jgi:hypothetical protein
MYSPSRLRQLLLKGKYLKMRLERNVYPDVYALPLFLTSNFELISMGTRVQPGAYGLIFSELNGTIEQLSYLRQVVESSGCPVAVIPGPPPILQRTLTAEKLEVVRDILRRCRYLLAYSECVGSFADGIAGERRSILIPWPFDYERTRAIAMRPRQSDGRIRILFNVPLRLNGAAGDICLAMKSAIDDVVGDLPATDRKRLSFHTFIYSDDDRKEFARRDLAGSLPLRLESRRGYSAFLRFLHSMSSVMNYSPDGVLGRIAFSAAALEIPGIFSGNVELHSKLYPSGTFNALDIDTFRVAARNLIGRLMEGAAAPRFIPDDSAAREVGDFQANAKRFKQLVELK